MRGNLALMHGKRRIAGKARRQHRPRPRLLAEQVASQGQMEHGHS